MLFYLIWRFPDTIQTVNMVIYFCFRVPQGTRRRNIQRYSDFFTDDMQKKKIHELIHHEKV